MLTAIAVFLVAGNTLVDALRSKTLQRDRDLCAWDQGLEIGEDCGEDASSLDDTEAWLSARNTATLAGWRGCIDGVPDANQIDTLLDGADLCRPPPRCLVRTALV